MAVGGTEALLKLESVTKRFGGVQAVSAFSLQIVPGEIVGLIGPNGSGKSTCVNLISGMILPSSGRIHFRGTEITGKAQSERVRLGLARTFQTTSIFPEFSCLENILMGSHVASAPAIAGQKALSRRRNDQAQEVLEFIGLGAVAAELAGAISSAQQRLLMVAIAIASGPSLVLLDEPAAGMVAQERRELAGLVRRIRDSGTAVLLIEHHMGLIMEVCDRVTVLNFGQMIAQGSPRAIAADPAVIEAYLGKAN